MRGVILEVGSFCRFAGERDFRQSGDGGEGDTRSRRIFCFAGEGHGGFVFLASVVGRLHLHLLCHTPPGRVARGLSRRHRHAGTMQEGLATDIRG
jgi:hypothetical protein